MPSTVSAVKAPVPVSMLVSDSSGFHTRTFSLRRVSGSPARLSNHSDRLICVMLLAMAALLWQTPLARPLDVPSWHEFDTASMARNFFREPGGILNPRIDWRKDGPGFAESEFPLHPWLMSQAYRTLNPDIIWGRLLSLCATVGSLGLVLLMARRNMSLAALIVAAVLFAVNKLTSYVATALQPEAFMLFFYLAGIYCFLRWRETKSPWAYWGAIAGTALAILEKSPAAHVLLFYALLILVEDGWRACRNLSIWWLGLLSLTPAAFWYAHAHNLWLRYGNSLGVSNENHWFGLDMLARPTHLINLVAIESLFVFSVGGLLLAYLCARYLQDKWVRSLLLWLVAIGIYYVVALRTTGEYWAAYYHVVSVAPAALLGGVCIERLRKSRVMMVLAGSVLGAIAVNGLLSLAPANGRYRGFAYVADFTYAHLSTARTALLITLCSGLTTALILFAQSRSGAASPTHSRLAGFWPAAALSLSLFASARLVSSDFARYLTTSSLRQCADLFQAKVLSHPLIVASGWHCDDGRGHPIAYDSPYMFYWLDKKGFSICAEEQSIPALLAMKKRGADLFVAEKEMVRVLPHFEQDLKQRFAVASECDAAWLIDLNRTAEAPEESRRRGSPGEAGE